MNPPVTKHWLAMVILILCAASQGIGFIVGKASLELQAALAPGESSWFIGAENLGPRFMIGVVAMVAIYGLKVLRLTPREWGQAAIMAGCSFVGCMFQIDGLQRTSGSVTAFFTQFFVVLIPLWAAIQTRRWPHWPVYPSVVLMLSGLAFLAGINWEILRLGRGETEVLIAAFFFSFMLFSINMPGFAENRSERAAAGMFLIESVLFAFLAWGTKQTEAGFSGPLSSIPWWWSIVTISAIATIGPFVLIARWQRFVSVTEAGMIYGLTPVFTLIGGLFLPQWLGELVGVTYENEALTPAVLMGAALVVAANVVMQLFHVAPPQPNVPVPPKTDETGWKTRPADAAEV